MAQFWDDFTGYSTGDFTSNPNWQRRITASTLTTTIIADGGGINGRLLRLNLTGSNGTRVLAYSPAGETLNAQTLVKFRNGTTTTNGRRGISYVRYAGNSEASTKGYSLYAGLASSVQSVLLVEDSTGLTTTFKNFAISANAWKWARTEAIGNVVRFKVWNDGEAEPEAWMSATNNTMAVAGYHGVGSFNTGYVDYGYFSIGTNGDIAPGPTSEAIRGQSGNVRIESTNDKNQTGNVRIQLTSDKDQVGDVRISRTNDKPQSGNVSIRKLADQTQIGNVRVAVAQNNTQVGNVRILKTWDRTQVGNVAIRRTTDRTQSGDVRIATSYDKTQLGNVRIQRANDKTQLGNVNIRNNTSRTQLGNVAIRRTTDRAQVGNVRVQRTNDNAQVGNVRVAQVVTRTQIGNVRIRTTVNQSQVGNVRVFIINDKNQTGNVKIARTELREQVGNVRIVKGIAYDDKPIVDSFLDKPNNNIKRNVINADIRRETISSRTSSLRPHITSSRDKPIIR